MPSGFTNDLINFSSSPPLTPTIPQSTSTSNRSRLSANEDWKPLEPEKWSRGGWIKVSSDSEAVKEKEGDNQVDLPRSNGSRGLPEGDKRLSVYDSPLNSKNPSPSHNAVKNIPLPPSPSTGSKDAPLPESPFESNLSSTSPPKLDFDAVSTTSFNSDETAQSRLSAKAKPFTASSPSKRESRITVVRNSDPPEFYPRQQSQTPPASPGQWTGSEVSGGDMDPAYYSYGYGGNPNRSSSLESGRRSPTWFSRPTPRMISITTPENRKAELPPVNETDDDDRVDAISTFVITSEIYDGTESPISDRMMREEPPRSPSEASTDPEEYRLEDIKFDHTLEEVVQVTAQADEDRDTVDDITAHFSAIKLSTHPLTTAPITLPPRPSSEVNSEDRSHSNPYSESKDGLLSPEVTGEKHACETPQHRIESDSDAHSTGPTLMTPEASDTLDVSASLDELEEMDTTWKRFRDEYGVFSGGIDEILARLRKDIARIDHHLTSVQGDGVDLSTPEGSLAKSRAAALLSGLKSARAKLAAKSKKMEDLAHQNEDMARQIEEMNHEAKSSTLQLRILDEEKVELQRQVELWESRARKLSGRYLRLEEDYAVLQARSIQDPKDHFIMVLLDGDGRIFEPTLLQQGSEGGRLMATRLVKALDVLCKEVLDCDSTPDIIVKLYIDVDDTIKDLQAAKRIVNREFVEFINGFQSSQDLAAVCFAKGEEGPGIAMTNFARFYANMPQCQMVILGAGYQKPFKRLLEVRSKSFIDKLYALRSSTSIDADPFICLGHHKLLYVKHLFSTGVTEWLKMTERSKATSASTVRPDAYEPLSVASSTSTASTVTRLPSTHPRRGRSPSPKAQPGRLNRLVSLESSVTARVANQAPWATDRAPRNHSTAPPRIPATYAGGGSLLDQMLESQSMSSRAPSSRASSAGSDDTVGPSNHGRAMVIPLDPQEGSVGGSPPSSDSDEPSVVLPTSARKYVRRPVTHATNDDDDTASEYSSVSAVTAIPDYTGPSIGAAPPAQAAHPPRATAPIRTSPATRPAPIAGAAPQRTSRPMTHASPARPVGRLSQAASSSNSIPLGRPGPSRSGRIPWSDRDSSTASTSRADTDAQWPHDRQQGAGSSTRSISEYKELRALDPSPCHRKYLEGWCKREHRGCQYGHEYILSDRQIEKLTLLAKGLKCRKVRQGCKETDEGCIYSHRCPQGVFCKYGSRCCFRDEKGYHLD